MYVALGRKVLEILPLSRGSSLLFCFFRSNDLWLFLLMYFPAIMSRDLLTCDTFWNKIVWKYGMGCTETNILKLGKWNAKNQISQNLESEKNHAFLCFSRQTKEASLPSDSATERISF